VRLDAAHRSTEQDTSWQHSTLGRRPIAPRFVPVLPALALPGVSPRTAPIERDATTDALVAELRAVIAALRRGQNDLQQERDHWRAALERE
jgi:hypothetical protein